MTFAGNALAVTAILWTLILVFAPPVSALRARLNAFIPLVIFSVFAVIFAVRGNYGHPDRTVYTNELQLISGHTLPAAFSLTFQTAREPLYIFFMWVVSNGGVTTEWLYLCVGTVSVLIYLAALLKLVPWWQAPLIWFTTLALGFFTSYESLVARQGLSMTMLFAAVCLILTGARSRWWILLLIAAALMHWSAIPIAVTIALVAFVRVRLRTIVAIWGVFALLFLTGVQERVLGPVAGIIPGLTDYTDPSLNTTYTGGANRRDFLIFSLVVLVFGLIAVRRGAPTQWYPRLMVFYTTLNIYFLLFGFILFSDRLAAYSWTLAPLVLAIPFAYPKSTIGRMGTVGFVIAVIAYGFVRGPFPQMAGITSF
jgi:hypothetical protein